MQKQTKHNQITKLKKIIMEKDEEIWVLKEFVTDIFNLSIDKIMKKIMDIAYKLTKFDVCFIYLLDNEKKLMILEASQPIHPEIIGKIVLNSSEGIAGWVAENKQQVIICENAFNDPRYKNYNIFPEERYHAILSLPIMDKNHIVGVINIKHKKKYKYNDKQISLLNMIISQFAGIMENLRLKQKAEKKSKEIETLSKISKTIVSAHYYGRNTEYYNVFNGGNDEFKNMFYYAS